MNKRIAKKILNSEGFHWSWYFNSNGIGSLAPKSTPNGIRLYLKANKRLKRKPYSDKEWLLLIEKFRRKAERKTSLTSFALSGTFRRR